MTLNQARARALKQSFREYPDEIVIVFKRDDGEYDTCTETSFVGDDVFIIEKYMNGTLTTQ